MQSKQVVKPREFPSASYGTFALKLEKFRTIVYQKCSLVARSSDLIDAVYREARAVRVCVEPIKLARLSKNRLALIKLTAMLCSTRPSPTDLSVQTLATIFISSARRGVVTKRLPDLKESLRSRRGEKRENGKGNRINKKRQEKGKKRKNYRRHSRDRRVSGRRKSRK